MSEWIESDEMAPLWKLVDMTHNKDVMARERDEAQAQLDEYRAQVDRLARALANIYGEQDHTICPTCNEQGHDLRLPESHQPGCMFWWSVEHVAALEDQRTELISDKCPQCSGSGRVDVSWDLYPEIETCEGCNGTGLLTALEDQ